MQLTTVGDEALAEIETHELQIESHRREVERIYRYSKGTAKLVRIKPCLWSIF